VSEERKVAILREALGNYYGKGDEYLFFCPRCEHHKRKLSVNLNKSAFKCWVCDWSGRNIYRIVRQYASSKSRYEWRGLDSSVEIENFRDKLFGPDLNSVETALQMPEGFVSLANKCLPRTATYPLNYLRSRGLSKTDIIKWKIGYCTEGEYASRIIIPSFNDRGKLNYFVTRTYDNTDWKKYMNPRASKNIIFNHLYLDFDHDIVLVEGVFDAIKAGENSVPLLGSTLTERSKLFYEIVKSDTPVYLALDPDAIKKTNKLISLLLKYDVQIYKIEVDPFKDVGEMTKEIFSRRKASAQEVNSENIFLSRISSL